MLSLAPPLTLDGLSIPRYGSVTLAEYLFLRDYFATPKPKLDEAFQILADFQQRQVLSTLLLVSRSSSTWTLAEVAELFSVEQVYELSGFLMGEWLRWQNPNKIVPTEPTSKEELNWEEVYWRLQLWYPGNPRFSTPEAFLACPLGVIESACSVRYAERRRELHLEELGVATLTAVMINLNRDKKSKPSKAENFFYFHDGELNIPTKVCNGFWVLAQRGLLPNWAIQISPQDALKKGRNDTPTPEPDYWLGEQIVLISPEVDEQGRVSAPLALVSCSDGLAVAYDRDNQRYNLRLGEDCTGEMAVLEFECELA